MTDEPTQPKTTRRQRLAYRSKRRREDKRELAHRCACAASAARAGITPQDDLGVGVLFFHDLHRALGESACPKCPECTALRREGRIDRARPPIPRAEVLARWKKYLDDMAAAT